MIYLHFVSICPDTIVEGNNILKQGLISIQSGNLSYHAFVSENDPFDRGQRLLYLNPLTESKDKSNLDPFYLPIEDNRIDEFLNSMTISVTWLQEYKNIWRQTLNSSTQLYEPEIRFKPVKVIKGKIKMEARSLSGEQNGYEIELGLRQNNKYIQAVIRPIVVLANSPSFILTALEKRRFEINNLINIAVNSALTRLDKSLALKEEDIAELLQRWRFALSLMKNDKIQQELAYVENQFEQRFRNKLAEFKLAAVVISTPSLVQRNTYILPDFNSAKACLVESIGGTILSISETDKAKIVIESALLKKEVRTQLEITRLLFTFPNDKIQRLKFMEDYCDATVDFEINGKYQLTFPAKYLQLAEKVTHHWQELQESSDVEGLALDKVNTF